MTQRPKPGQILELTDGTLAIVRHVKRRDAYVLRRNPGVRVPEAWIVQAIKSNGTEIRIYL